jgi:hypothetical protein
MRHRLTFLLLLLLVLAGCGERGGPPEAAPTGPGWERLDDLPLSKRTGPVVVWTGTEVLAIGGETGTTCPPNADCVAPNESAKDGAALDPETGHWRTVADAPLPIPAYTRGVVVAGRLFVLAESTLLAYDLAADSWQRVRGDLDSWTDLAADGERLVLVSGSDEQGEKPDLVYDVGADAWSRLPEDPIGPAFDRGMVATERGLVLLAKKLVDNPGGGDQPSFVLAALLDRATGTWERLPDSDQLGGGYWTVIGDRVIDAGVGSSDGGGPEPGDYGREVPIGGALDLATKTWSRLPDVPRERDRGWAVDAPGAPLTAAAGWIYDDARSTWTTIPRPSDGPFHPGPAVWAGDRLVVVTGERRLDGGRGDEWHQLRDLRVWSWTR